MGSAGGVDRRAVLIRLTLSPLILLVILAVLWVHDRTGDPLATDLLLLVMGAAAGLEMALLLRRAGRPASAPLAAVGAGLLAGVGLLAPEDPLLRAHLRATLLAVAFVLLMLRHVRDVRPQAIEAIALPMLPLLFVGLLLSSVREVGAAGGEQAARVLAWVLVTSKASDIGGWLVGVPLGRHKMVPSVSPGKSWEGVAGGVLLATLAAVGLPPLLEIEAAAWSPLRRALFGVSLAAASILAGVLHSGWKRRAGAKDSARLLPEVGGVLDMVDSILLAGPVAWAWLALGL